jgi:phospholipase/carboxylesterase
MQLASRIAPPRSPSPSPPLLVLLHGIGADEVDLLPLVPHLDPRFLVISARAPHPEPPGYRWYAIDWRTTPPRADPAEIVASRELLARFVEEAPARHGADPSSVFLLGFSQGAIMALALLLARPGLVRGVVGHSGRLARVAGSDATAEALSGAEVLLLHGEQDPVVPAAEGRKAYEVLASLIGPRATFVGFPGLGHGISPDSLGEAARWLTARVDAARGGGVLR